MDDSRRETRVALRVFRRGFARWAIPRLGLGGAPLGETDSLADRLISEYLLDRSDERKAVDRWLSSEAVKELGLTLNPEDLATVGALLREFGCEFNVT